MAHDAYQNMLNGAQTVLSNMKYNILISCVENRYKDLAWKDITEESTIEDDLHRLILSHKVSVPEMEFFQEIRSRVEHCRRMMNGLATVEKSVKDIDWAMDLVKVFEDDEVLRSCNGEHRTSLGEEGG